MKLSEIIQSPLWFNELVRRWLALTIGFVMAIVIGYWIADQQMLKLGFLAGVLLTVVVAVAMQRNAWLLILLTWNLQGSTYVIPIPVSVHDMAVILATCAYATQHIVTGKSSRAPWGILQALVALNCAHIVLTYVIHPVGLRTFGSGMMGARHYFDIAIAACAYWVIVHMPDSYKTVSRILLYLVAGTSFLAALNLIVYIVPATTRYILPFYGGVDYSSLVTSTIAHDPTIRRFTLRDISGLTLIQVLTAYYPPRTLLNPLRMRCYLFLLGLAAVLAAGFRNSLLIVLVSLTLASWFHRGWREVILWGFAGLLAFGVLVSGQGRFYQLPLTAQRSLSFLPGQWNEEVKDEVNDSSQGRFKWWRTILSEGVIKNWWVGDGFGVSENDFELLAFSGHVFDWFTLTGSFHNGPLSTVRYTGLVGLVLFYALMFVAGYYSLKCVNRCRGSPLFPVSIFLAIQLIWTPIHFTVIFGAYDSALPDLLFRIALLIVVLRMAETHLPPAQTSAGSESAPIRSVVWGPHL